MDIVGLHISIPLASLVLQLIVALIFVGSLLVGWYNLKVFQRSSSTSTFKLIMDEYRKLIDDHAFDRYPQDLDHWREELVKSDFSPHTFYYTQLNHISRIGEFYEYVGVLVRHRLGSFELLFELLPFPNKFWEDTLEFQAAMQEIMFADFWNNFVYLHDRYVKMRKERSKPRRKQWVLRKESFLKPKAY